jgi:hypothetical protein
MKTLIVNGFRDFAMGIALIQSKGKSEVKLFDERTWHI